MNEMHRVLRTGGQALIIDLRPDVPNEEVDEYIRSMHMSPISAFMTRFTFKYGLTKTAHPKGELRAFAAKSSFGAGEIRLVGMSFEV